jgi:hypothetical protein
LAFPSYLYIDFLKASISAKKGEKDAQTLGQQFVYDLMKHKAKDVSPVETGFKPSGRLYSSVRRRTLP